ncbi:MAG: DUF3822 family protein, partial [Sediminibacterium sp.]
MAKKKIGIYGTLESTANNKVEDLYLVVDEHSIAFSVKNIVSNTYRSFEYFVNDSENNGWSQLVAYLQNNSKLIQNTYNDIHFVMNNNNYIVTKKYKIEDTLLYKNELTLLHDIDVDEEVQITHLSHDQILVFAIPDQINTLLSRSFPSGKWHHFTEFLIRNNHDGIQVHFFANQLCMVIQENGQLKLMNHFKVGGDDQNTFTLLNSCTNAGVKPNTFTLTIAGIAIEQLNWKKSVEKYFETTHILMAPSGGIG